ncbi:response regulator [Candidatus Dojkabacteria bacterium]|nr:response regulator [Candidatus Dojkabacteria bacterium]
MKKKILIIEDEQSMARVLSLKLGNMGFECFIAKNGNDAVDLIQKQNFDLIVLDLMMPQKDGFAFLSEVRKAGNKTPVIIASNLSQPEDIKRAEQYDILNYFSKADTPISTVVNYISQILNSSKQTKSPQVDNSQAQQTQEGQQIQQLQQNQQSQQEQQVKPDQNIQNQETQGPQVQDSPPSTRPNQPPPVAQ